MRVDKLIAGWRFGMLFGNSVWRVWLFQYIVTIWEGTFPFMRYLIMVARPFSPQLQYNYSPWGRQRRTLGRELSNNPLSYWEVNPCIRKK